MKITRPFLMIAMLMAAMALLSPAACAGDGIDTQGTNTTTGFNPATQTQTQTPIPAPPVPPDQPLQDEPESPLGTGLTTDQTVGTLIDGLQLLDIRWSDHGSYFRVVFDFGTAEGEPVLQIPHAEASMSDDGKQVRVLLGGVRSISGRPNVTASELPIENSKVVAIKSIPSYDDQALLYAIELSTPGSYALAGLGSPGRIVVDIIKE